MKLKLVSDFHDYYDPWFDRDGDTVFRRMTTDGPSRIQMFDIFSKKKSVYNPPIHGIVRDIWKESQKLVVYTDLRAHCGEGKELLPSEQAYQKYPYAFASEYIETDKPASLRTLQIGWVSYYIHYESDDKWRSNVGDVNIELRGMGAQNEHLEEWPLVAIDYVIGKNGPQAVDLNVAPGIRHTGIEDHLKGPEVVDLIRIALEKKEKK